MKVSQLVASIYRRCPVGCCLHVILDDGNLEDWVIDKSKVELAAISSHADCRELLALLAGMTERERAYALGDVYPCDNCGRVLPEDEQDGHGNCTGCTDRCSTA